MLGANEVCPEGNFHLEETPTRFTCEGGVTFAWYQEVEEDGCAVIQAGGQSYRLPDAEADDGIRYSDGQVQFWQHYEYVTLQGAAGGPYRGCTMDSEEWVE